MLQNVEYSNKPERFIYERANGMAHITLADNIREGVNANGDNCWYCDLYMMVLSDNDNMAQRLEKSYDLFLAKAKADEVAREAAELNREPTLEERMSDNETLAEMAYVNSELALALIEMEV